MGRSGYIDMMDGPALCEPIRVRDGLGSWQSQRWGVRECYECEVCVRVCGGKGRLTERFKVWGIDTNRSGKLSG